MNTQPPANPEISEITPQEAEQIQFLRRSLAEFLAHQLPFSLFHPRQAAELKKRITTLVEEKLEHQQLKVPLHVREKLIHDIIDGLHFHHNTTQNIPKGAVAAATGHTVESLRSIIAPYLASHLSNDFLQPGNESFLSRKIMQLADEKIAKDSLQIDPALRRSVIEAICRGMNVEPPAELSEAAATPPPAPEPAETAKPTAVAQAPAAATLPKPAGSSKGATKQISRIARVQTGVISTKQPDGVEIEEIAFTDELKRELLLAIGRGLKPEIMGSGDEAKVRSHILELMETYCESQGLELENEIKEMLITAILGGEGVEFQL